MKTHSHHQRQPNKHEALQTIIGLAIVLGGIGGVIVLGIAGRTDWWPEARDCTVIGSRVVQDVLPRWRHPLVIWRGEYRIQYEVNGKRYFTWASAGWIDTERSFVRDKVDDLTIDCPVRVQYNPKDPAESVTHLLQR